MLSKFKIVKMLMYLQIPNICLFLQCPENHAMCYTSDLKKNCNHPHSQSGKIEYHI